MNGGGGGGGIGTCVRSSGGERRLAKSTDGTLESEPGVAVWGMDVAAAGKAPVLVYPVQERHGVSASVAGRSSFCCVPAVAREQSSAQLYEAVTAAAHVHRQVALITRAAGPVGDCTYTGSAFIIVMRLYGIFAGLISCRTWYRTRSAETHTNLMPVSPHQGRPPGPHQPNAG